LVRQHVELIATATFSSVFVQRFGIRELPDGHGDCHLVQIDSSHSGLDLTMTIRRQPPLQST
jgi:hypothetical protein